MVRALIKPGLTVGRLAYGKVALITLSHRPICPAPAPHRSHSGADPAGASERLCQPPLPLACGLALGRGACRWIVAHLREAPATAPAARGALAGRLSDGNLLGSAPRFPDGVDPYQHALLPDRRLRRHPDRRPSRPRAGGDGGHAHAGLLRAATRIVPDHAGRDLLRRTVRRVDHLDSRQPPRGGLLHRHDARRLPDVPKGQGRRRSGHIGHRFLLRRDRLYPGHCPICPPAGQGGPEFRRPGVFRPHGPGSCRVRGPRPRLAAQGHRDDRSGAAVRTYRTGRELRDPAVHLRFQGVDGRDRFCHRRHGDVRVGRDHPEPRDGKGRPSASWPGSRP